MEQDIVNTLQRELGRLLSPIEQEILNDFKEQGFSDLQIRDALKEAVFSGAVNLRYISKILKSWKPAQAADTNTLPKEQDLSWLE